MKEPTSGSLPSRAGLASALRAGEPRSLGILFAALVLLHWPTLDGFLRNWITSYTPGLVIGALIAFVVWRDWERIVAEPATPSIPVWILILPGALVWYLAAFLGIQVVQQLLLPTLLVLWLVAVAGTRVVRRLAPVLLVLPLAYPVWGWLTRPLQLVTIEVNRILLFVTGFQADVQGEFVRIPYGTFVILGSCSGFTYFMVGTVVGVAYAYLFIRRWVHRLAVLALAVGLALLANWLRVYGLILIGYATEMRSPLMTDHGTYGWIIFGVCMAAFIWLAGFIDRRDRAWWAARAAAPPPSDEGAGTATRPVRFVPATAALLVGPALLAATALVPDVRTPADRPAGLTPMEGWTRTADGDAGWGIVPAFNGADEHRVSTWSRGDESVQLDRVVYRTQRQGKELVNSENRIAPDSLVAGAETVGPLPPDDRQVREITVVDDGDSVLVWFWYVVDGTVTHRDRTAKLLEFPAFLTRAPASELVAVSTPCDPEGCQGAARRLRGFVTGSESPPVP